MTQNKNDQGDAFPSIDGPTAPRRDATYWCFTPDQLESALAAYRPFSDEGRDALIRSAVRSFMHSALLSESGLRFEAPGRERPSAVYGGGS